MTRPRTLSLFISGLILLLVFAALAATPAAATQIEARAMINLDVRSGPGLQYPVQFAIPENELVGILATGPRGLRIGRLRAVYRKVA